MKRNHARQALNDKIHVVFFAALTILVHVLIQISIADVYVHHALRFFMVYFCLLVVFLILPHSLSVICNCYWRALVLI